MVGKGGRERVKEGELKRVRQKGEEGGRKRERERESRPVAADLSRKSRFTSIHRAWQ
jgi:hypothetical protein